MNRRVQQNKRKYKLQTQPSANAPFRTLQALGVRVQEITEPRPERFGTGTELYPVRVKLSQVSTPLIS